MVHIYFTQKNLLLNSKQRKKNDRSPYSFARNDDLSLWRGPAVKKKPPFFNACALAALQMKAGDVNTLGRGEGTVYSMVLKYPILFLKVYT